MAPHDRLPMMNSDYINDLINPRREARVAEETSMTTDIIDLDLMEDFEFDVLPHHERPVGWEFSGSASGAGQRMGFTCGSQGLPVGWITLYQFDVYICRC